MHPIQLNASNKTKRSGFYRAGVKRHHWVVVDLANKKDRCEYCKVVRHTKKFEVFYYNDNRCLGTKAPECTGKPKKK